MTAYEYKQYYESEAFVRDCVDNETVWGTAYASKETVFRVWAVNADKVSVCLYRTGTDEENGAQRLEKLPMEPGDVPGRKATYECTVQGDLDGIYYTYAVERDGKEIECQDPYARACGANGLRSMVVDMASTDPEGWEEDSKWRLQNKNTVIYELHVKDFSYHAMSGVSEANRGRYLAFTEESRAMEHLKSMGVSHVHLLPVFDFASVDETGERDTFNWGYDPMNYNVPEGSYATDCYHGKVRIQEVKRMVQALHRQGLGVIMDVVYNHTYASDGAFQILAPYYYYRQNEDGSLSNGSACGNETASERYMCGQFIRRSVSYWAQEYHMDGFRFDLMGLHDTDTMNGIRRELDKLPKGRDILMYGEPWCADESPIGEGFYPAVKDNLYRLSEGIAVFSDDTRDAVKGSVFFAKEPGFVNGAKGMEPKIAAAYKAWCTEEGDRNRHVPKQIISYVSVHDNYTLWDKLVLTGRKDENFEVLDKTLLKINKLTAAIIFTCLGTPLFQAGEEFARTKKGDENSYRSAPQNNCLDWERAGQYQGLTEYYKGLIALRGKIALYMDSSAEAAERIHICSAEDGVVIIRADNSGYGDQKQYPVQEWQEIWIALNSNPRAVSAKLPEGRWEKLADEKSSWVWKKKDIWSKMEKTGGKIKVAGRAAAIYGRKEGI